ncbi:MAG: hypothetical protein GF311_12995 [Candidatus Lokiarchaeota archaeon]|nr:hypothetical protein [Candidatus Lokiarchaeota archaeon]
MRLEQGFPQDWIYIERKVKSHLSSEDREGVRASENFYGKEISGIFRRDILNVYNQEIAKVTPIIGPNGA